MCKTQLAACEDKLNHDLDTARQRTQKRHRQDVDDGFQTGART